MIHICADEVKVAVGVIVAAAPLYKVVWAKICQLCGRRTE